MVIEMYWIQDNFNYEDNSKYMIVSQQPSIIGNILMFEITEMCFIFYKTLYAFAMCAIKIISFIIIYYNYLVYK